MTALWPEAAVKIGSASDIIAMLGRHYIPDGPSAPGVLATEIEAPDGTRRADAVWAPWTRGAGLVGHEVKVSRGDVIAELTDPMKADAWMRYCSQWYLVLAHPSLADGLDVPMSWGIMAPPSGRLRRRMTVVRPAPMLKPADTGPAWQRIASWNEFRLARRISDLLWKADSAERDAEYAKRELRERQQAETGRVDRRAALIGRVIAELDARRDRWTYADPNVDDVVSAIMDVEGHRQIADRLRGDIEYMAKESRRIAEPAVRAADELEKLARKRLGA